MNTPVWCKIEGCDKWEDHVKSDDYKDMQFYDDICSNCEHRVKEVK